MIENICQKSHVYEINDNQIWQINSNKWQSVKTEKQQ